MKLKRGDPVEVEWEDITGQSGWRADANTEMKLMPIRSVGYFLKRDRTTFTLAQSIDDDQPHTKTNDRLTIGLRNVRRVRKLRR